MLGRLATRRPLRWARWVLAAAACQALRFSAQPLGVALVYHSLDEDDGDPARELVAPHGRASFESHIRFARAFFAVVPASGLRDAMAARRRAGRIPLAVTFDDDLRSHRTIAAPILADLGVAATFFLTGATLDHPSAFWWQLLQAVEDRRAGAAAEVAGAPAGTSLAEVALALQLGPRPAREEASRRATELLAGAEPEPGLRRGEIGDLARADHEIGFHTLRHDFLPNLTDDELATALHEGRAEVAEVAGTPVTVISYPHGGADERVARAAAGAGFTAGFTTAWSASRPDDELFLLGRIEPPRDDGGALGIRVASRLARRLRRA